MLIRLKAAFEEQRFVALLALLTRWYATDWASRPELPGLYDLDVRYENEEGEELSDMANLLMKGVEDCDTLAPARAGELRARGARALTPGDGGFEEARRLGLTRIEAHPLMLAKHPKGRPGLYHIVVEYRVGERWYRDDPSARLGMNGARRRNPFGDRPYPTGDRPDERPGATS